jgi:hypothetical protein
MCRNANQEGISDLASVATTLSYTTDTHHRAKSNVDILADMFFTYCNASCTE